MNGGIAQPSHWQEFREILRERLCEPAKHPTYVMYFLGFIIIVGGFGFIESIVTFLNGDKWTDVELARVISACYTYFVAIAATAAVDFVLSLRKRRFMLMFFLFGCLAVMILAVISMIVGTIKGHASAAILPTLVGYVASLFLWWLGNAGNPNLLDTDVEPSAPTGGDIQVPPAGNLGGFRS
jgi:hypothetical protein